MSFLEESEDIFTKSFGSGESGDWEGSGYGSIYQLEQNYSKSFRQPYKDFGNGIYSKSLLYVWTTICCIFPEIKTQSIALWTPRRIQNTIR